MRNTFFLLRHGHTQVDKTIPISTWVLSKKGNEQVQQLIRDTILKNTDVVISSTEEKAIQTATPIANSFNKSVIQYKGLRELNRDNGGFLGEEEYESSIQRCLTQLNESVHNWETATHALERFSKQIEKIDTEYDDKNILIVGHGFTINLYFASILNILDRVYERFNTNTFCDWGIIKEHMVVRDIANMI